jgi:hypothetical protein
MAIKLRKTRRSGRDCRNPEAMEGKLDYIPVFWIPAIHAGMTAYFNSIAGEGWDGGDQKTSNPLILLAPP